MKRLQGDPESGFTLIETIIIVVVTSFVAVMLLSYFGKGIVHSADPIGRLQASASLHQIMEKITAQYAYPPHWQPTTQYAVNDIVLPSPGDAAHGYEYIAIGGGTSGSSEPNPWHFDSSAFTDGTVTWKNNGLAPTLTAFQTTIGAEGSQQTQTFNGTSVSYKVIQNRFIKFDPTSSKEVNIDPLYGGASAPAYGRYLKVTIGLSSNAPRQTPQTMTTLFVMR